MAVSSGRLRVVDACHVLCQLCACIAPWSTVVVLWCPCRSLMYTSPPSHIVNIWGQWMSWLQLSQTTLASWCGLLPCIQALCLGLLQSTLIMLLVLVFNAVWCAHWCLLSDLVFVIIIVAYVFEQIIMLILFRLECIRARSVHVSEDLADLVMFSSKLEVLKVNVSFTRLCLSCV